MRKSRALIASAILAAGPFCGVLPVKADIIFTGEFTDTHDPRNIRIGPTTTGSLTVDDGSVLEIRAENSTTFGGDFLLSRQPGSFGFGLIDGPDSAVNMIGSEGPAQSELDNAATFVGRGGTGILTIQNGGSLTITDPFAAEGTGLDKGESVYVGYESTGTGTLNLDNGSVTIDSIGAYLVAGRDGGDGTVTLENGSTILLNDRATADDSRAEAIIGRNNGGSGDLVVDNSTFTINSDNNEARFLVGRDDAATVGSVTVTGSAAELNITGEESIVRVGQSGQAGMTVTDDANVFVGGDNARVTLGLFSGSTGTLLVSNGGTMDVGESGGYLTVGAAYNDFGFPEGGTGVMTITGAGSRVSVVNDVEIGAPLTYGGGIGNGTVVVSNGGLLEADNVLIGLGGTLAGNGTIAANVHVDGGTLAPGLSPGTIHISGDFLMDAGELVIEIGGLGAGQFDVLEVTGSANLLGGTILFQFIDDFLPSAGDTLEFLTALGPITVDPTVQVAFAGLAPGFLFDVDFTANGLLFAAFNDGVAVAVSEPASLLVFLLGLGMIVLLSMLGMQRSNVDLA